MVEIDPIDDADERDDRTGCLARPGRAMSRKNATRCVGSSSVARTSSFRPRTVIVASAGGAQVAHPVDLAPGGPDPAPADDLDDRDGRGARQAALPAADGDEPVEAQRDAGAQQGLGDRGEERDPARRAGGAPPDSDRRHLRWLLLAIDGSGVTQRTREKART